MVAAGLLSGLTVSSSFEVGILLFEAGQEMGGGRVRGLPVVSIFTVIKCTAELEITTPQTELALYWSTTCHVALGGAAFF